MRGFLKINHYLKWMVETYAEIRAEQENRIAHRIVEHNRDVDGDYQVTIHVIGKNITFKASPNEIITDDLLLETFSRKDIRLLTYLACNTSKETHELLGQRFVRNVDKFFFKLKNARTGKEIEKSAEEISADASLIKLLSPEDAHKIGYITANQMVKLERKSSSS